MFAKAGFLKKKEGDSFKKQHIYFEKVLSHYMCFFGNGTQDEAKDS